MIEPESLSFEDRPAYTAFKNKLVGEGDELPAWFTAGFWLAISMNAFVMLGQNCLTEKGVVLGTEDLRQGMRDNQEVRIPAVQLIGALTDLRWSPDDAEDFLAEKVSAYSWNQDLWSHAKSYHSSVLSDLDFKARELDLADTKEMNRRPIKILIAILEEVPGGKILISFFKAKK
ncbi:MAG: hypothetical protein AAFQ13_13835 [Pseudomonadota bacterium]